MSQASPGIREGALFQPKVSYLRVLWAFFIRDAKTALSYRLHFFLQTAAMFSLLVTFFFLSLMMSGVEQNIVALGRYGGQYFPFVLVGTAFSGFLDVTLRTLSGSIRNAQVTGTLEAMLTTRAPIGALVAGSSVYSLFNTTLRATVLIGLGVVVFQVPIYLGGWFDGLVVLLLTVASSLVLGIFAAGFIVLFKQGDPVTAAISGLSFLLSGILYPREILPSWVQRVADFLPMTHTLEAMRLVLLMDAPTAQVTRSMFCLALFSGLGLPLSLSWFRWAVGRARKAGSLARY